MKQDTEQKMEDLLSLYSKMEDLQAEMDGIKIEISEKAFELKEYDPVFVANLSKTPFKDGKYYSIKSRYSSELKERAAFLCSANRPFGSWLKKDKKQKSTSEEDSAES